MKHDDLRLHLHEKHSKVVTYFEGQSVAVALLNFSRTLPLLRNVFAHGTAFAPLLLFREYAAARS